MVWYFVSFHCIGYMRHPNAEPYCFVIERADYCDVRVRVHFSITTEDGSVDILLSSMEPLRGSESEGRAGRNLKE